MNMNFLFMSTDENILIETRKRSLEKELDEPEPYLHFACPLMKTYPRFSSFKLMNFLIKQDFRQVRVGIG